jgi:hypothetical protein
MEEIVRQGFDKEAAQWVADGWLVPHDVEVHGPVKGLIAFMAKDERRKGRVRPIMDYREMNKRIISNPGTDCAVCPEKLRRWRKMGENVDMLDLKKAYLQLFIHPSLQTYQCVRWKGVVYVMTRMSFGLSIAPKVMDKVLSTVLAQNPLIQANTDNYIDDIICDRSNITTDNVKKHLERFGLVSKEPEPLEGARVLGLRIERVDGLLQWKRDNDTEDPDNPEGDIQLGSLTRRELYSLCGRLVGLSRGSLATGSMQLYETIGWCWVLG